MQKKFFLLHLIVLGAVCLCLPYTAHTDDAVRMGDFIRTSDGTARIDLTPGSAFNICMDDMQGDLPTARELAVDATRYGAVLVEVPDFEAGKFPEGFTKEDFNEPVEVTNLYPFGNDQFYYSAKNYKRPEGDLGKLESWSVSVHRKIFVSGLLLEGETGFFWFMSNLRKEASVRCVFHRKR